MKLYLSGPMTGYKNYNYDAFNQAAAELREWGHYVVNPAEMDELEELSLWSDYLRRDLKCVLECQGVATLPNWECSKGAALEVYVAQALSMLVLPYKNYREITIKTS